MDLNKINHEVLNSSLIKLPDALHNCLIEEVNIYNQAFLSLERPLIDTSVVHEKTQYESPVVFTLDGDINGNIVCLLDTYGKKIDAEESKIFQSLYIESMNILLGKMMTSLENNFGHTVLISNPRVPKDELISNLLSKTYNTNTSTMGYKLISNGNEYDCRIIFNINKKII